MLMNRSVDSTSTDSPEGSDNGNKSSTLVKPRQIGPLEITAEQVSQHSRYC